jgi:hypothetical protein
MRVILLFAKNYPSMETHIRMKIALRENRRLSTLRVGQRGCGGPGGYIIESCPPACRAPDLIDGDVFEPST